jgi:Flp pilus assembly protein CpaB
LEEEDRKEEQCKVDEANFALESAATQDVQQYLKDCRQRRRMSLALRAKEKRHHAQWQEREAERRRQQQSRDTRDRALDHRHMEMASQKERARIAMDAIRHAHCTFSINPFAGLLDH